MGPIPRIGSDSWYGRCWSRSATTACYSPGRIRATGRSTPTPTTSCSPRALGRRRRVIGDRNSIPDTLVTAITAAGVTSAASTSVPTTASPTTTARGLAERHGVNNTTVPTRNPFASSNVIRLDGATAGESGRAVAGALDTRSDADRSRGTPAVAAAVGQHRQPGGDSSTGSRRRAALSGVVRYQRRCPGGHCLTQ